MMGYLVRRCILQFGRMLRPPRGGGPSRRSETLLGYPDLLPCSAWVQVPVAAVGEDDVAAWPFTVSPLASWSIFLISWEACIGHVRLVILGWVVFPTGSFLSCVRCGLVKMLCHLGGGRGVQFQCWLFRLVQALIFGVPVAFWRAFSDVWLVALWIGSVLALQYRCSSLPAAACSVGEVWAWSCFSCKRDVRSCLLRLSFGFFWFRLLPAGDLPFEVFHGENCPRLA